MEHINEHGASINNVTTNDINNDNNVINGYLCAKGMRVGVVVARFNGFITTKLLSGAYDAFIRHQGDKKNFTTVWVPGSFEIPLIAKKLATRATLTPSSEFHAIVCLGAVIRGATPHFEYVASEVAKGVAQVGIETGIPVLFGVLTTDNIEQAIERAGSKAGNKGAEAMLNAIEMVDLLKKL
ncbi:MAG: 6,7-dimethyl-8-ribityllumazine synthase [Oligoflexia bacterium]|nr:6,7-dimethyl-8-ribityllumazine synthase [Oligoflexia bacterium]